MHVKMFAFQNFLPVKKALLNHFSQLFRFYTPWFFDFFRGYRNGTMDENGLIILW